MIIISRKKNICRNVYQLLNDLERSDKSVVIIKGAGGKAFCSGIDLLRAVSYTESEHVVENTIPSLIMEKISRYQIPYVALINGITFGGGSFFSMTSKYRVSTERTSFAMPEALIGFYCNAGASYFLSRLKHNLGYYIALTCERINGYDVKKYGLATHFVESHQLEELIVALGECKSDSDVNNVLGNISTTPTSHSSELDGLIPLIDKCFSGKSVEEIFANLDMDGSEAAKKIIRQMNIMSPTSLKACHRVLQLGKDLSLRECLKLEQNLTVNFLTKQKFAADFQEGIRSVIIEKDKNPNWNSRFLQDVKEEDIDDLFQITPRFELKFDDFQQAKL